MRPTRPALWPDMRADPAVRAYIRRCYQLRCGAWPILLIPIAASVALYFYIYAFGGAAIQVQIETLAAMLPQTDVAVVDVGSYTYAHILWQCTSFLYLVASSVAIGVAIAQILRLYAIYSSRIIPYLLVTLLIVVVSFVVTFALIGAFGWVSGSITDLLFFSTGSLRLGTVTGADLGLPIQLARLHSTLAFYFLSSAAFLIVTQTVRADADPRRAVTLIAQDICRMRSILYAGSLCLFTGIFSLQSFVSWRLELLPPDLQDDARYLGDVLILIWTIQWSVALAGLYLLPVFVFFRRAEIQFFRLVASGAEIKRREWMEEHGLGVSFGAFALKFVALFGPLALSSEIARGLGGVLP